MRIAIVNGPNLNLTGKRETAIYGKETFEHFVAELDLAYPDCEFIYVQSNVEGEIINLLQELDAQSDIIGIILNAGAYTHTSIAIGDTVRAISNQVIEVHLSNVFQREDFRQISYLAAGCVGSISGFGMDSYKLAVDQLLRSLKG